MQQRFDKIYRPTFFTFLFFAILGAQIFAPSAWAARVLKSQNKTVLIDLEGDAASVGDRFFVMIDGKKRGLVTITKVKNGRALATLNKGVAKNEAPLTLAKAAEGKSSSKSVANDSSSHRRRGAWKGLKAGALLSYSSDSQSADVTSTSGPLSKSETVKMTGSGFGLKAFGSLPLSGNLGMSGRFGFESFKVTGTSNGTNASGTTGLCSGSDRTNCNTSVTYVTIDALLTYQFPLHHWTPFVEAGLGIYYPLSKSTTAVNPNITTTSLFLFGAGAEINLGANSFIPVIAEYGLFPPSSSVKSSIISLRAGYGMRF